MFLIQRVEYREKLFSVYICIVALVCSLFQYDLIWFTKYTYMLYRNKHFPMVCWRWWCWRRRRPLFKYAFFIISRVCVCVCVVFSFQSTVFNFSLFSSSICSCTDTCDDNWRNRGPRRRRCAIAMLNRSIKSTSWNKMAGRWQTNTKRNFENSCFTWRYVIC